MKTALSCSRVGIILFYQANYTASKQIIASVFYIFPTSLIIKTAVALCRELAGHWIERSKPLPRSLRRDISLSRYLSPTIDVEMSSREFNAIEISEEAPSALARSPTQTVFVISSLFDYPVFFSYILWWHGVIETFSDLLSRTSISKCLKWTGKRPFG